MAAAVIGGVIAFVITCLVLYFVIKTAVKDAILETRGMSNSSPADNESDIKKVKCPVCGNTHDMDYPKCPFCKHQY